MSINKVDLISSRQAGASQHKTCLVWRALMLLRSPTYPYQCTNQSFLWDTELNSPVPMIQKFPHYYIILPLKVVQGSAKIPLRNKARSGSLFSNCFVIPCRGKTSDRQSRMGRGIGTNSRALIFDLPCHTSFRWDVQKNSCTHGLTHTLTAGKTNYCSTYIQSPPVGPQSRGVMEGWL